MYSGVCPNTTRCRNSPGIKKNEWLWAKDLKDGYYNVAVNEKDIHKLGFMFDEKIYTFQPLSMCLSSSPNIFTEFMHFLIWTLRRDRPDSP